MSRQTELRLFQLVVILAAAVPIAAGAAGILHGPAMIGGFASANADLDSHFSYLSGLLLGIGMAFVFCVMQARERTLSFRILGVIVITGGLARLFAASRLGLPGPAHQFAYVMELIVVPCLLLWHHRVLAAAR
jgi:hypothetical protein